MSSTNTPRSGPLGAAVCPLIDPSAVEALEDQLCGVGFGRGYLRAYVELWDARLLRLSRAVEARNHEQAMDAVLSLKVSSAMAGAARLAELAAGQEAALCRHDFAAAGAVLEEIAACGAQTMSALAARYLTGPAQ